MPEETLARRDETLRDFETTLLALSEVDPSELPAELLKQYETELQVAIRESVEKRERMAIRLFTLGQRAAVRKAAAGAHKEKARELELSAAAIERDIERLKDYVLGVMMELPAPKRGPRKLEGTTATFTASGVGGLQRLTITDPFLLHPFFKTTTIELPTDQANALVELMDLHKFTLLAGAKFTTAPDGDRIRNALAQPCELCHGLKRVIVDDVLIDPCDACGGEGTRRVRGARLEPRGVRLVVK